jgi:hypothetical protein
MEPRRCRIAYTTSETGEVHVARMNSLPVSKRDWSRPSGATLQMVQTLSASSLVTRTTRFVRACQSSAITPAEPGHWYDCRRAAREGEDGEARQAI